MAERKTYPSIPASNWWGLRRRAQTSPPQKVDPDYLQSVLGVQEGHAKNLISPLTAVGLIDDAGKLSPLGEDWRHDESYPEACKKILEAVYPASLRDAFPPPTPDRAGVERWFSRNAQVGSAAALKMASTYLIVAAGDPEGGTAKPKSNGDAPKRTTAAKRSAAKVPAAPSPAPAALAAATNGGPSVHVDVQVHISPEASADQIDAIFQSMSKHLYPSKP